MRKKIRDYLLVILLLTLSLSFQVYYNIHTFNHTAVKNNIAYLSSDIFKGRLPGTIQNKQATFYIQDQFKEIGLKPFEEDYFQNFIIKAPTLIEGKPYLNIIDNKGKIIKEYKYNKDFKEDMLNFRKNSVTFSKENSQVIKDEFLRVIDGKEYYLFYAPGEGSLKFRSSFVEDTPFNMYTMITKETLKDIEEYMNEGYKVSCHIPYKIEEKKVSNVIGYIEGKNPNLSPIVVSAHFDHVGTDLGNTIYSGALDNASGISFIIELAEYIESLGKPERNILFVGFNAEEFGCVGSTEFVNKYNTLLKDSKVYNFDMIGTNNAIPLYVMGGATDTDKTPFIHAVSNTISSEKIPFNYLFSDSSDHQSFRKAGIDAVTFIDNDTSRIHTPEDRIQFIDTKSIDRCFKVASKEIIRSGFNGNPIYSNYDKMMLFSLGGIILLLISSRLLDR